MKLKLIESRLSQTGQLQISGVLSQVCLQQEWCWKDRDIPAKTPDKSRLLSLVSSQEAWQSIVFLGLLLVSVLDTLKS